ncbi:diaminobutyrate acetyltransferase [Zobellella sp. DQSA1]|uniref:diaminobutyrate acetyltransferase n=1 Tax=Zobellella sp. DQSA1 TaxID=3342386 RepID=UPI0035C1B2AF
MKASESKVVRKFEMNGIKTDVITLHRPAPEDGVAVNDLIDDCPPLDINSHYCNLLQCTHFSTTSIKAVLDDELVGFISGYITPDKPNTLFVWQVAVSAQVRGRGVGKLMLTELLNRATRQQVCYLETTVTPDNRASWALFTGIAKSMHTSLSKQTLFERDKHFAGQHDDEVLLRIGPFSR